MTRFLARFLARFFARFWTRFLARVWGREKLINAMYSTTGTENYSVQYYSHGKIYYIVSFKKRVFTVFWYP